MNASESRRAFLRVAAGLALAAPYVSKLPRAGAADSRFDPSFGTATDAARAIQSGVISSRELLAHTFKRIDKYNASVNAFVTLAEEQAMARAKRADDALAKGSPWGPLHGVPILMKDLRTTAGLRTTFGSKAYERFVPTENDLVVTRLLDAGAIIVGKTNTPEFGADHQTYNEVIGTTNNPWDTARSPGGSTGGGAAALATGLGFLELGSDLGGSIRNPSHFCGIYGHKPSFELVPRTGPRPPGAVIATPDNQWVNGPMARSAQDLQLELELLAGPPPTEAVAYRLQLPAPRGARLKDYRIGYVLTDPFCPPAAEVAQVLSKALEAIARQGAQLSEGWPSGIALQRTHDDWFFLAVNSWYQKEEDLRRRIDTLKGLDDYYSVRIVEALSTSYHQWRLRDGARLQARAIWQDYFREHDAFLMPVNLCAAFPHDQRKNWAERAIQTADGKRPYRDLGRWISVATLSGCPATVAPIGRTAQGLPVGIQIMGPFLEDATPIRIAALLADVVGGFQPPPGYSG